MMFFPNVSAITSDTFCTIVFTCHRRSSFWFLHFLTFITMYIDNTNPENIRVNVDSITYGECGAYRYSNTLKNFSGSFTICPILFHVYVKVNSHYCIICDMTADNLSEEKTRHDSSRSCLLQACDVVSFWIT